MERLRGQDNRRAFAMKLPRNCVVIAVLLVAFVVVWGIAQRSSIAERIAREREDARGGGEEEEGDRPLDAIFVLMGGQTANGGVPLWVKRRLDRAVELQQARRTSETGGLPPIVSLGAGTDRKPPKLTAEGFIWYESNSGVDYLNRTQHVDFHLLQKECTSYDTQGNGYFSLIQFAIPTGWRHIAIITSEFHMTRSEAIYEWIFGLPGAGAGLDPPRHAEKRRLQGSRGQGYFLEYHSVSDEGLDAVPLEIRKRAEVELLKDIRRLSIRIKTLPALHDFIYLEKGMYNTAKLANFGKKYTANNTGGLY